MVTYLGSFVQSCCGEGGTLQTNITDLCGGVFALYGPHWVCPSLWWYVLSGSTLLRLQVALPGNCGPWVVCTFQIYPAQFQVLGYSTNVQTWLGLHFVPFPGPSSSGNQVHGEHTLLRCGVSYHLRGPSCSGVQVRPSPVCHVSLLGS